MDTTHFGEALATPGPNTHEVFALLAPLYAEATLRRVYQALPSQLRDSQSPLYNQAVAFLKEIDDGTRLFRPEIGRAGFLAAKEQQNAVHGWIQFLLTLHEAGFKAQWRLHDLPPCMHLIAGLGVVLKGDLEVVSNRDSVNLMTSGNPDHRSLTFEHKAGGLTAPLDLAPPHFFCNNKTITLVGNTAANHLWFGPHEVPYQGNTNKSKAMLVHTCDVLSASAPAYSAWVSRALTHLALIEGIIGHCDFSYSLPRFLGLVYLSQPRDLIHNIEGLVHECAHQHYHLALLVDPLQNGADQNLYPSPLKTVGRPIERILVSYHALANICLALNQLLSHDLSPTLAAICRRRIQSNAAMAQQLARHLAQTKGLTPTGQAVWHTLAAAFEAAGLPVAASGV